MQIPNPWGSVPVLTYAPVESCQSWANKPRDCMDFWGTSSASSVCCRKLCCHLRRSSTNTDRRQMFTKRLIEKLPSGSRTFKGFAQCFFTFFLRSSPTPAPSPDADVHCWPGICQFFVSCQFFQFHFPRHGTTREIIFGSWPLARQQRSQHPAICHQLLDGWQTYLVKQRSEQKSTSQPPQVLHKNPHAIHKIHPIHSTTWKKFGLSSCKCQSTMKLQRSSRTLCLRTGQHTSGTKASKNNLWKFDLLRICFEGQSHGPSWGWSHLHSEKDEFCCQAAQNQL